MLPNFITDKNRSVSDKKKHSDSDLIKLKLKYRLFQ